MEAEDLVREKMKDYFNNFMVQLEVVEYRSNVVTQGMVAAALLTD